MGTQSVGRYVVHIFTVWDSASATSHLYQKINSVWIVKRNIYANQINFSCKPVEARTYSFNWNVSEADSNVYHYS